LDATVRTDPVRIHPQAFPLIHFGCMTPARLLVIVGALIIAAALFGVIVAAIVNAITDEKRSDAGRPSVRLGRDWPQLRTIDELWADEYQGHSDQNDAHQPIAPLAKLIAILAPSLAVSSPRRPIGALSRHRARCPGHNSAHPPVARWNTIRSAGRVPTY